MSTQDAAASRLVIPGLSGLYQALAPYSYSFMRFCVGAMLVPHGYFKLFRGQVHGLAGLLAHLGLQPALAWAYWVGILEFFGGIMLALGLLTRPIAVMIAVEMAVAIIGVHLGNGYFWTNKGFEYPLMWGLLCLAIAVRGGDRLSLDRAIGKEL